MSLEHLGWNERLEQCFVSHRSRGREPARVSREERDRYLVLGAAGEHEAVGSGRLRREGEDGAALPAVGDWVALRPARGDGPRVITAVLPRASVFVRKAAGELTERQTIAANLDFVFVVAGLDAEYNPRRLERYLATAWEGGAVPVVILNKADLAEDLEERIAETRLAAPGAEVVALSARTGEGLDQLAPWLARGRTVALVGSSGVGKSTLVNALLGEARQTIAEVRPADARGRHTTTRRDLLARPSGALLVDTPGLRELQLWADESSLAQAFPDVEELAAGCRFRDCHHDEEPGCAVRAAVERGEIDSGRLESWHKLQRELRWLAGKQDVRVRLEETARWRMIQRSLRLHPKYRERR